MALRERRVNPAIRPRSDLRGETDRGNSTANEWNRVTGVSALVEWAGKSAASFQWGDGQNAMDYWGERIVQRLQSLQPGSSANS